MAGNWGSTSKRSSSSHIPLLPSGIQHEILSLLPANERVLSGRLVDKGARDFFSKDCTASLALPLPPHAAPCAQDAGQQHVRLLRFRHKLGLLSTAAASGSEANLEVAWEVLQPSGFPELLQSKAWARSQIPRLADPGVAAVKAGHPQLLGWLLRHCPALLQRDVVLCAAARHCDLAGLRAAWKALEGHPTEGKGSRRSLGQEVLEGAAGSLTPDAVAKMAWALAFSGRCSLQVSTAAAAASSGDLGRLQWLRDRGCPMNGRRVLAQALQHGDLPMVQWLVDEAGCRVPDSQQPANVRDWGILLLAAVASPDGAAKLQWLLERGAPLLHLDTGMLPAVLLTVVQRGRVGTLKYLQELHEASGDQDTFQQALIGCADTPGSIAMAEHLRAAGCAFSTASYQQVAKGHDLVMMRWFACNAGVSAAGLGPRFMEYIILCWPSNTAADDRDLLEAVQLLVGTAGYRGWDGYAAVGIAAEKGDLALVQYLLQQQQEQQSDYKPCRKVMEAAVMGGCEALLTWLVEQHPGCLASEHGALAYLDAAHRGDMGTLAALRRLGVPWGARDILVKAVRWGCEVSALRWLVEHGAPVGTVAAMDEALMAAGCTADRELGSAAVQWDGAGQALGGGQEQDAGETYGVWPGYEAFMEHEAQQDHELWLQHHMGQGPSAWQDPDAGEQRAVGPDYDTGEQRAAGPEYDTGEQRAAGPEYDTGEQRAAGPEYDTGEQRAVGPEHDTGEQRAVGPEYDTGEQEGVGPECGVWEQQGVEFEYGMGQQGAVEPEYDAGEDRDIWQGYEALMEEEAQQDHELWLQHHMGQGPSAWQDPDAGEQRAVGPKYDTGEQRAAGPEYDTGEQRAAGPEYDTGEQRAVGREHDTGEQRAVGPEYDTGEQEGVGPECGVWEQQGVEFEYGMGQQGAVGPEYDAGEDRDIWQGYEALMEEEAHQDYELWLQHHMGQGCEAGHDFDMEPEHEVVPEDDEQQEYEETVRYEAQQGYEAVSEYDTQQEYDELEAYEAQQEYEVWQQHHMGQGAGAIDVELDYDLWHEVLGPEYIEWQQQAAQDEWQEHFVEEQHGLGQEYDVWQWMDLMNGKPREYDAATALWLRGLAAAAAASATG